MQYFAKLIKQLDETNKTLRKVTALTDFFAVAGNEDKLWAIAILSHRRPKRPVSVSLLREWAAELADIPYWLFEESYHTVGDLAETIALLCSNENHEQKQSLSEYINLLINLKEKEEHEKKAIITNIWTQLSYYECFVFNKLLTGGFRIGVSQKLMTKALSKATGIDESILAHRLMGNWSPEKTNFNSLILEEHTNEDASKPYPFFLAYPLERKEETIQNLADWQIEWKWDGIRGQIIKRKEEIFVWSRGEELITDKFPEFSKLKDLLPDGTVIDGEILCYKNDSPLSFNHLQTRIGRKNLTSKILKENPVIVMAYDLLESDGEDLRNYALFMRREKLELICDKPELNEIMKISPLVKAQNFSHLEEIHACARSVKAEGFMLKNILSSYKTGRVKGDWWKWKTDPFTIDAVLTYAMSGHGRRANLYTDYTFALWQNGELVTFAKAYSGLTDAELKETDSFIRKNTIEKFGPVRQVKPELVFELGFEGIAKSSRHKSGVAVRFPRILRIRKDKKIEDANSVDDLIELMGE